MQVGALPTCIAWRPWALDGKPSFNAGLARLRSGRYADAYIHTLIPEQHDSFQSESNLGNTDSLLRRHDRWPQQVSLSVFVACVPHTSSSAGLRLELDPAFSSERLHRVDPSVPPHGSGVGPPSLTRQL